MRTPAAIVAVLVLIRLPFLWTGDIQEDAFIVFRTAFNLADHGELTFNLGESYGAVTSLLYAYLVAGVRLVAGAHAVGAVLLVNALLASVATVCMGTLLQLRNGELWRFSLLVGASSGALIAGYSGMETAVVLLYLTGLTWGVLASSSALSFAGLVLIAPLVRPELVVVAAMAVALRTWHDRRSAAIGVCALTVSLPLYLTLIFLHGGTWVPPSLAAKLATYGADAGGAHIAERIGAVYISRLSLLPASKLIPTAVAGLVTLILFSFVAVQYRSVARSVGDRYPRVAFLAMVAIAFPVVFVAGGFVFPWYMRPSAFAFAAILAITVLTHGKQVLLVRIGAMFVAASAALQLAVSFSVGRQEAGYRASVGRYLRDIAGTGDTLELEPAGRIPFESGLATYDEVGLSSPRVLPYIGNGDFPVPFLRDVCPAFTVQRGEVDSPWFAESYELIARFEYRPQEWASNAVGRWILARGSHAGYLVYRRRAGIDCR